MDDLYWKNIIKQDDGVIWSAGGTTGETLIQVIMEKIKLTNQENMSELALCWHQSKVTEEHWDVAANEKEKEWAKL